MQTFIPSGLLKKSLILYDKVYHPGGIKGLINVFQNNSCFILAIECDSDRKLSLIRSIKKVEKLCHWNLLKAKQSANEYVCYIHLKSKLYFNFSHFLLFDNLLTRRLCFQLETPTLFPNFPLYIYCNDSFKPLTFTFGNSQLVTAKTRCYVTNYKAGFCTIVSIGS